MIVPAPRPRPAASVAMSARPKGAIAFIRPASDQLFFVYTGGLRGVGINPVDFFAQTRLLERNVVMLQDRYRLFYQRGVSPAVPTFDALVRWQKEFRHSLPHVRRVFCLGTSLGGYAAVLGGLVMGVEQVWAFGPPTVLPDVPSLRDLASERRDLALALAAGNGRTKYEIHYSRHHVADANAAARLTGCPGVTLWPQPGRAHNVVKTLLESGRLTAIFPDVS